MKVQVRDGYSAGGGMLVLGERMDEGMNFGDIRLGSGAENELWLRRHELGGPANLLFAHLDVIFRSFADFYVALNGGLFSLHGGGKTTGER